MRGAGSALCGLWFALVAAPVQPRPLPALLEDEAQSSSQSWSGWDPLPFSTRWDTRLAGL